MVWKYRVVGYDARSVSPITDNIEITHTPLRVKLIN